MTTRSVCTPHLALYGGPPVREELLPYSHHRIHRADVDAVVEVLNSGWLTQGPEGREFEEAFASFVNARFAVSFSSGTAALHGAVFAAGLEPGFEAITTPLTFCATANCSLFVGAEPRFVDIRDDTLAIDPERIAEAIGPRTRALIPVDYAGAPAELDAIRALADRHGLVVIEDASHALGAELDGRRVGGLSTLTTFSLHPAKHVAAGEGGVVTTDDPTRASRLKRFRSHGIDRDAPTRRAEGSWYYDMQDLGYNYRLSDLASALARSQLKSLPDGLQRRSQIADRYSTAFAGLAGLRLPAQQKGCRSAWHLYPVRVDSRILGASRDEVIAALRAEGIAASVHYRPVHLQSYYRNRFGYAEGDYPIAERAGEELISLPLFPGMLDRDIADVIEAVRKVLDHWAVERRPAG